MAATPMAQKQDGGLVEYAIIGGGISGLTLAIALQTRNINCTIYEQAGHFGEIGAGVSFTANAVQAMRLCSPGIEAAFEKVRTSNVFDSKKKVWFDYHDGYHSPQEGKNGTYAFTIANSLGQTGVHRARFLSELVKLFPAERAVFGKRLEELDEEGGKYILKFHDGTTAKADAVIGCDGIKSKTRSLIFGADHPCSRPTYTYKYAYRALAKMENAVKAVGEEKAMNACMHMGPGGHVLTFPVNHGEVLNVVAFRTTKEDWPDHQHLTRPATREDALRDFEGWGEDVRGLLKLCRPELDIWAIFHLGDNPVPKYNHNGVLLIGDAAHATSPHHGAGAGMCIEDSAILASLLADDRVRTRRDVEAAFETFNDVRHERGNWLPQTSAYIGNLYEWLVEGIGKDFAKIEHQINTRNAIIADVDVADMCTQAQANLSKRLERCAL